MNLTYDQLRTRIGTFTLNARTTEINPDFWQLIMSKVLVVRCEYIYIPSQFKYTALSSLFDPVLDGFIPEYIFRVNEYDDLEAIKV